MNLPVDDPVRNDTSTSNRSTLPAMRLRKLEGRSIVLTGASSGIGRATALAMAAEGASLVLAARSEEPLRDLAQECEAWGVRVLVVPTDVTDPEAVKGLAGRALDAFGDVDVWINNVGVGAVGAFEDTPLDAHRRVIEANLLGHVHGAHAILSAMRRRGQGTLINMISVGGWVPAPYAAAYSASKFGLRGFSEALRGELTEAPRVHVCEVYPTFVDSPGMSHGANYSGRKIRPPPLLIDPRRVARVLVDLSAADRPRAKTYMGAPALPGIFAHALAPDLVTRVMGFITRRALAASDPALPVAGNLFEGSRTHETDGGFRGPGLTASPARMVGAAGLALLALWALTRSR